MPVVVDIPSPASTAPVQPINESKPTNTRRRKWKWILIGIAITILVGAAILTPILILRPAKVPRILAAFENNSNRTLGMWDTDLAASEPNSFKRLRKQWGLESLWKEETRNVQEWKAKDGLGLSGSTFMFTANETFIIKSIDREFEWNYFWDHMMKDYVQYMRSEKDSLLTKITAAYHATTNTPIDLSSHFMAMLNVAHGPLFKKSSPWDLKPSYFSVEKDLLKQTGGGLAEDITGHFIMLPASAKRRVMTQLVRDTAFLEKHEILDYSLFIARSDEFSPSELMEEPYRSTNGTVYRLAILDIFYSGKATFAKGVRTLTKITHVPALTITADPADYRRRFLEATDKAILVDDSPEFRLSDFKDFAEQ